MNTGTNDNKNPYFRALSSFWRFALSNQRKTFDESPHDSYLDPSSRYAANVSNEILGLTKSVAATSDLYDKMTKVAQFYSKLTTVEIRTNSLFKSK